MQQSPVTMQPFAEKETRMDLLLWRHAEAEEGIPDLKRKLTARGEKQAQQVAGWLKQHAPNKLRILSSPALRCQQTATALSPAFATDKRLSADSSPANLLAAIGWPEGGNIGNNAVLVVGHQPVLGQTAALLLSGAEADWSIKKGALWWFSNRTRRGETQTILRAALSADLT